jgi:hypothetical protein
MSIGRDGGGVLLEKEGERGVRQRGGLAEKYI